MVQGPWQLERTPCSPRVHWCSSNRIGRQHCTNRQERVRPGTRNPAQESTEVQRNEGRFLPPTTNSEISSQWFYYALFLLCNSVRSRTRSIISGTVQLETKTRIFHTLRAATTVVEDVVVVMLCGLLDRDRLDLGVVS